MLLEKVSVTCPNFIPYFKKRVIPLLKDGVVNIVRKTEVSSSWTNNNAESLNHVFKQLTDWKPQPLPELCNLLSNHIVAQFKNLESAMVDMGKFRLHASFEHFKIPLNTWAGKLVILPVNVKHVEDVVHHMTAVSALRKSLRVCVSFDQAEINT
jgi:hypothetical protein